MPYPKTPELDKLSERMELQEFTQQLGEALDDAKGFTLAAWVPDRCHRCYGLCTTYDIHADEEVTCDRCDGTGNDPDDITLAQRSPSNRNLAELMGLDHEKMEAERDAVLIHVQAEAHRSRP